MYERRPYSVASRGRKLQLPGNSNNVPMDGDPLPYRRIFGESKTYNDDHVLTNWKAGDDEFHRIGFLMAAEIVAKHMLERRTGRELSVYPMLFCLRHFIELSCKRIIAWARCSVFAWSRRSTTTSVISGVRRAR